MKILIVDGWTEEGNLAHLKAGCDTQAQVFDKLIKDTFPSVETTIVDTHDPKNADHVDLNAFHAAIWTGGGGNIYEDNVFNREQLRLCERVLREVPYYWGSCWGLQVAITVFGGEVAKARVPEIGIAKEISVSPLKHPHSLYRGKPANFDAPAHHIDEICRLPSAFEVIAENSVTLQAIAGNGGKIFCTQYHPELSFDYVRKLLTSWEPNYRNTFTKRDFQSLLARLSGKEEAEGSKRTIEFKNWLTSISNEPV